MTLLPTRLGRTGPEVSRFALGCAALSGTYGQPRDDAEGIAVIHAALDAGIKLLDTADFYAAGHNEMLIGRALSDRRRGAVLSVKIGAMLAPGKGITSIDTHPDRVRDCVAHSLTRLGTDHIDILRPARLDPEVPIEETIGAMAELVQEGWIGHIGLSEMGPETIRRAAATHPICDVQLEYSLMSRGPEAAILPLLDELGIGMTAYGVLSHGLLTDRALREEITGHRAGPPRFSGDNLARNRALIGALAVEANARGVSTAELATAWAAAKGTGIVPLLGPRTRAQLDGLMGAPRLTLTPADIAAIEAALPAEAVAGTRYPERFMAMLDSE